MGRLGKPQKARKGAKDPGRCKNTAKKKARGGGGGVGRGHLLCKCEYGRATKRGPIFRVCLGRGIFHFTNSGKRFKYTCLKGGSCLSGKGLLSYLCPNS